MIVYPTVLFIYQLRRVNTNNETKIILFVCLFVYLLLINRNPVSRGIPFVSFYVVDCIFQVSVSFRQICL